MEKHFKIVEIPVVARLQSKYNETVESAPVAEDVSSQIIKTEVIKWPLVLNDFSHLDVVKHIYDTKYFHDGFTLKMVGKDDAKYSVTIQKI